MASKKAAAGEGSGPAPRLKLVIRRLPPTLPEEIFWKAVSPWVTEQTCSWKRYIKGKAGDAYGTHAVHSRAYCLMTSIEALVEFNRAFDGHVFRSKAGTEYQAVVEYAPLQKTPFKAKVKADGRQGTIDDGAIAQSKDPDYLSFLESLKATPTKPVLETSTPLPQPTTTPLLDHLRTHGKAAKKKSKKTDSSSTEVARSSAIASVNAAAAKRLPGATAQTSVNMVAGKGRDVVVTTVSEPSNPTGKQGGKSKKGKSKGGKGGGKVGSPTQSTANLPAGGNLPPILPNLGTSSTSRPVSGGVPPPAQPRSGRTTPQPGQSAGQNHHIPDSPGRGGARGRGRGRGGPTGPAAAGGRRSPNGDQPDKSPERSNRGSGVERGRGRGRGGGNPGEKVRSAKGAVIEILNRNASESARGGTRGRGRGGSASGNNGPLPPNEARIDM